jgi:hypothetical protein
MSTDQHELAVRIVRQVLDEKRLGYDEPLIVGAVKRTLFDWAAPLKMRLAEYQRRFGHLD